MRERMGAGRTGGRRKFEYKKRSAEVYRKRGAQSGGRRDSFLSNKFTTFRPKKGDNCLRILPPTWDDPQHFGLEVWVHYSVGLDKNAYLCLNSKPDSDEECPICREKQEAERIGDTTYGDTLRVTKRVLYWLIDRDEEKEGPLLWAAPWTMDRDICLLAVDKRTGEHYNVDDPEEGYDVEFSYTSPSGKTPGKYDALMIARRSSELGNVEWLDFIIDNPLSEVLVYHDAEYIEGKFAGKSSDSDDAAEDKKQNSSRSRNSESWTYNDVMDSDRASLEELAIKLNFTEREVNGLDDDNLKEEICKELKLEAPKEQGKGYKDRLSRLRRERNEDEEIPF
jgi:hypothetical protein